MPGSFNTLWDDMDYNLDQRLKSWSQYRYWLMVHSINIVNIDSLGHQYEQYWHIL